MVENKEIMEEKKEDEPFDHLDLSIDLRKRPDLRKKMTPEMKAERQRKQIKTIYEKKYQKDREKYIETVKQFKTGTKVFTCL